MPAPWILFKSRLVQARWPRRSRPRCSVPKLAHHEKLEQGTIDARFALLTAKEREVAVRVVGGKSSREIADEFGLSIRTIENHRARIMDKLHADSVVELVHLLSPRVAAAGGGTPSANS